MSWPPKGSRDVGGLVDQDPAVPLGGELGLPAGHGRVDGGARRTDAAARLGPGGRRQRADLGVGLGDRRPVTGVGQPDRLQLVQVPGARDGLQRRVAHPLHLFGR